MNKKTSAGLIGRCFVVVGAANLNSFSIYILGRLLKVEVIVITD